MKRQGREWMYERLDTNKRLRIEYANGVREFINHAKEQVSFQRNNGKMRCPCTICNNTKFLNEAKVKSHLLKKGFCVNYYNWVCHGEDFPTDEPNIPTNQSDIPTNPYQDMVNDALRDRVDTIREEALNATEVDETPNPEVQAFFEMLKKAEEPVCEGSNVSVLQAASRLLSLKCEFNVPHKCVDGFISLVNDILPKNNLMTTNFYETKKLLKALELPHEKIDVCSTGCMLFWDEDKHLVKCKKCGQDRYKPKKNSKGKQVAQKFLTYFPITHRLQRIYATKHIAEEMRWHAENPRVSGTMAHPSDAESWKHFDALHPDFASEPRNVRLGLCTDGFAPFGQFGKSYSCWPVMLTPYNLPPWLCMKKPFIFLSLIVPGPKNPKKNLDVFLQPLIRELKQLWEVGVFTYDVSKKQNFQLRASLMWTINDFPAYGMLSGWGTAGEKACPYCGNGNKSFWLKNGRKWCWFDCHRHFLSPDHSLRKDNKHFLKNRDIELDSPPSRLNGYEIWECVEHLPTIVTATDSELKTLKDRREGWWKRSIFWELPYWKTLLIRHNLDVMHIEKNFFEQLIHTVMDNKSKTSHNESSKADMKIYCGRRSEPKFILDKPKRKVLCEWISKLKFPDGYASDLGRCVNESDFTLHGLKSHDCHVFMERLLPVALKNLMPKNEWNAITELSQFFRDLCVSTIKVDDVIRLEKNIPEILCKLEMIFPPSFFNSMEHLPVHLPYEVKVGGPVQYRWMYPFERFLNHLKRKIGNKAYVEGSICNAYLLEEISNFCSFYFEDHIDTKAKNLDIGNKLHLAVSTLPELFQDHLGRTIGKCRVRSLEDKEYDCAHKYVLSNCEVLKDCIQNFILTQNATISVVDVWNKYGNEFCRWFRQQASVLNDDLLKALAMGPSRQVRTWNRYSINGYNFRTFNHKNDVEKSTINNGVSVSSIDGADYYGILDEVIELSYAGANGLYNTILFKCNWMDNSSRGMNIHKDYKLVEVHRNRKYPIYDPFVLSYQVEQVYYAPYPNTKKDRDQWSVVFKTKARSNIEAPVDESVFQEEIIDHVSELSSVIFEEDETEYDDNSDVGEISIMNEVVEGNLNIEEGENSDDDQVLEQQIDGCTSEEDEELFPEYDNNDLEHNDEEEDDL